MKVLYLSWDGPSVSYMEGLFLPIFAGLRAHGIEVAVYHFVWGDAEHLRRQRAAAAACGVAYMQDVVPRARGAAATFLHAVRAAGPVGRAARRLGAELLMPRSIMPAVTTVTAGASGRGLPYVYDIDGLALDERREFGGLSGRSAQYRLLKLYETLCLSGARSVLARSADAVEIYRRADWRPRPGKYVETVNGRDPAAFALAAGEQRRAVRAALSLPADVPVVCYSGSFGAKYDVARMVALVRALRQRLGDVRWLVLTGDPDAAQEAIGAADAGVLAATTIRRLTPDAVARTLPAADLGFCLYKDTVSMRAIQATKLGEYLLCGLPVVASPNVVRDGIDRAGVAFALAPAAAPGPALDFAVAAMTVRREALRHAARREGLAHFTAERSVARYAAAIRAAAAPAGARRRTD